MRNRITNLADIFDRDETERSARYYASYGGFNFDRSLAKVQRINDKLNFAFESLEEIENDRETMRNICDQLDYNISLGKGISVESAAIINSNINNIYKRYGIINKSAIVALEGFENGNSRLEYTQKLRVSIEEGFFEKAVAVIKEIWEWIKKQWSRFINWVKDGASAVEDWGNRAKETLSQLDPNEQVIYTRSWYSKVKALMTKFGKWFIKFFKGKTLLEKVNDQIAEVERREQRLASGLGFISKNGVDSVPKWAGTFIIGPIAHWTPIVRPIVNWALKTKNSESEEKQYLKNRKDDLLRRREALLRYDDANKREQDRITAELDKKEANEISTEAQKAATIGANLLTEEKTNGEMLNLMDEMLRTFKSDNDKVKKSISEFESIIDTCRTNMAYAGKEPQHTANIRTITKLLKDQSSTIVGYVNIYYDILVAKAKEAIAASKANVSTNDAEIKQIKKALKDGIYKDNYGNTHHLNNPDGADYKKQLEVRLKQLEEQRKQDVKSHNDKWKKEQEALQNQFERDNDILGKFGGKASHSLYGESDWKIK